MSYNESLSKLEYFQVKEPRHGKKSLSDFVKHFQSVSTQVCSTKLVSLPVTDIQDANGAKDQEALKVGEARQHHPLSRQASRKICNSWRSTVLSHLTYPRECISNMWSVISIDISCHYFILCKCKSAEWSTLASKIRTKTCFGVAQ